MEDGLKKSKKRHVCTFENCTKTFSRPSRLEGHLRGHCGEKLFTCNKCAKSYFRKAHLTRHDEVAHNGGTRNENNSVCNVCKKSFINKSNMRKHFKNVHQVDATERFKCHQYQCLMKFPTWRECILHKVKDHKMKFPNVYRCEENDCFEVLMGREVFHTHLQTKHNQCFCIYDFQLNNADSTVVKHRKTCDKFNPEERPLTYKCRKCKEKFNERSLFQDHAKTHVTENACKKFICEISECKKQFAKKFNFQEHQRWHQRLLYTCTENNCTGLFSTKSSLRRHVREIHESGTKLKGANVKIRKVRKDKGIRQKKMHALFISDVVESESSACIAGE